MMFMVTCKPMIFAQFKEFATSDRVWWQGLARILENMGYIKEADVLVSNGSRNKYIICLDVYSFHMKGVQSLSSHLHPHVILVLHIQDTICSNLLLIFQRL